MTPVLHALPPTSLHGSPAAPTYRGGDPELAFDGDELDDFEDHIAEALASAAIRDARTIIRAALSIE